MNSLRTLIIDDEPHFIEIVQIFLRNIPYVQLIDTAQTAEQAERSILLRKPDLILLDIEMPKQNGFDLLRKFVNPHFKVIFITGYDHYAIRAIKFSAIDYLLKPIDPEELTIAIDRVKNTVNVPDPRINNFAKHGHKSNTSIMISSMEGFQTVRMQDIVSIESKPGNYSIFSIQNNKRLISTKPLKYYDELFTADNFFRAHRSYMVNLQYFSHYDHASGILTLADKRTLLVATRRRHELSTLLRDQFNY